MNAAGDIGIEPSELPLPERPGIADWTENYCNQAFSPGSGVGFWTHLSRMAGTEEIWRDVMIAYVPGDRFLVAKGFGYGATERGPGSGAFALRCEESWQRWTMHFRGAVRDVSGEELRGGPLRDQLHHIAALDLTWAAISPVWDLGERMAKQTWAQAHYEQACRVTGTLTCGDERWEIDGTGIRDHSRGARVFGTVREHWWLSAQFPSGRSFAVLQVINHGTDVTPLSQGYMSDGTSLQDAEVVSVDVLQRTPDGGPARTRIQLRAGGEDHELEGRMLQAMPFAMDSPNGLVLGISQEIPLTLRECQTEYRWGDEVGYGLTERSWTPERR